MPHERTQNDECSSHVHTASYDRIHIAKLISIVTMDTDATVCGENGMTLDSCLARINQQLYFPAMVVRVFLDLIKQCTNWIYSLRFYHVPNSIFYFVSIYGASSTLFKARHVFARLLITKIFQLFHRTSQSPAVKEGGAVLQEA